MKLFEKKISSEQIFDGKVVNLKRDIVELENGAQASREVITHPGGVCIVPLTENNEVIMVRQFRYPFARVILEIPAGKLNYGENPLECGKRELLEETGATAREYISLGEMYPSPAYITEIIYIYLARGLSFSNQKLDEDEFLEVEAIPLDTLVKQVLNGTIKDSKTQIAILKTKMALEQQVNSNMD